MTLPLAAALLIAAAPAKLTMLVQSSPTVGQPLFSPDERLLAFGENRLLVWDVASGILTAAIPAHRFSAMAFTHDGRSLLVAHDGALTQFNARSGAVEREFKVPLGIISVAASPDGRWIAAAYSEGSSSADKHGDVLLWNAATGESLGPALRMSVKEWPIVSFGPGGMLLAYDWHAATPAILWDVAQHAERGRFDPGFEVSSAAISPDGKVIGLLDSNGGGKLFEASSSKLLRELEEPGAMIGTSPNGVFSLDGTELLSLALSSTPRWSVATGKLLPLRKLDIGTPAALSASQGLALVRWLEGSDFKYAFIDYATGALRARLGADIETPHAFWDAPRVSRVLVETGDSDAESWDLVRGTRGAVLHNLLGRSDDGKTQLFWREAAKAIALVDSESGRELRQLLPGDQLLMRAAVSNDRKRAAVPLANHTVRLFDGESGEQLRDLDLGGASPASLGFTPSGDKLLCRVWTTERNPKAMIFDTSSGALLRTIDTWSIALSHDGERVVYMPDSDDPHLTVEKLLGGDARTLDEAFLTPGLALSPDDRWLAVRGVFEGVIPIWDLRSDSPKPAWTLKSEEAVSQVVFTGDGQALLAIGSGQLQRWSLEKRALLATFVGVGKSGTVAITPDGNFMASPGATRALAFRIGEQAYAPEQFDLALNRPDLVLSRLGLDAPALIGAYQRRHQQRLRQAGYDHEPSVDESLPVVAIDARAVPVQTDKASLVLPISASDAKTTLRSLQLWVNGVPALGARGRDLSARAAGKVSEKLEVALSNGANLLEVSATNAAGVESLRQRLLVQRTGALSKTSLYVLAIGVSNYGRPEVNLNYAAKDASDLADTLSKLPSDFEQVQVLKLVDAEATKARILEARSFFAKAKIDDVAIVFIAGHGLLDDKLNYYFGASGVDFEHPAQGGISHDELEGLLADIGARRKLLLMDTCFSGEVDELAPVAPQQLVSEVKVQSFKSRGLTRVAKESDANARAATELVNAGFSDLRRGSGTVVIASASGAQYALESPEWHNGVFTYSVLHGLQRDDKQLSAADRNKDSKVTVSELQEYISAEVQRLTGGRQTPTVRGEGEVEFDLFGVRTGVELAQAIRNGDDLRVQQLVVSGGDVNQKLADGSTPLQIALESHRKPSAAALMKAGARIPAEQLGLIAYYGDVEALRIFAELGGSLKLPAGQENLMTKAAQGYTDASEAIRFLASHGFDLNAVDPATKLSPLQQCVAARGGPNKMAPLQTMLALRPRLDARDAKGRSLIALAAAIPGSPELLELLLKHGAKAKGVDQEGRTPLMVAAKETCKSCEPVYFENRRKTVQLLVAAGVDVNARDAAGETALSIALASGNEAVADELRRAGAK